VEDAGLCPKSEFEMTRKSKKKARIRARMAKQGVPYSVAARRGPAAKTPPATPTPSPTTVIVLPGRQLGLDAELVDLRCVAATKQGARCRNPVEAHGQVARWDVHNRYRVDWEDGDSFWIERYGSAERLFNSYIRQRCKLHLDSDAPDLVPPQTYDLGPLVPLDADVIDTIGRRAFTGIMNMVRRGMDTEPDWADPTPEVAVAATGDMDPLLALVSAHPLPTDLRPSAEQPDPNFVNAPLWTELLALHYDGPLTTGQLRLCVKAGAPSLIDELA
jgi:hypothetical protein